MHQLLSNQPINTQQTLGLLWLLPKQVCLSQVSYSQDTTSKSDQQSGKWQGLKQLHHVLLSLQFSGM